MKIENIEECLTAAACFPRPFFFPDELANESKVSVDDVQDALRELEKRGLMVPGTGVRQGQTVTGGWSLTSQGDRAAHGIGEHSFT